MWYMLPDSGKQYPVTIARVKEIVRMNAKGERPAELEAVEITGSKVKEIEPTFVDVVGQISLRSLERNSKKRKDKEHEQKQSQRGNGSDNPKSRTGTTGMAINKKGSQPPKVSQPQPRAQQNGQREKTPPSTPNKQNVNRQPRKEVLRQPQKPQQKPPQNNPDDNESAS